MINYLNSSTAVDQKSIGDMMFEMYQSYMASQSQQGPETPPIVQAMMGGL
jgi:hypothetical protein